MLINNFQTIFPLKIPVDNIFLNLGLFNWDIQTFFIMEMYLGNNLHSK